MPLVALALFAVAKAHGLQRKQLVTAAVVFGASYVTIVTMFFVDPGDFGNWYMD